jgi:hypothetical protein
VTEKVPKPSGDATHKSAFRRRLKEGEPTSRLVEIWSAVLLSVTVILTAWSAFEASKWGGAMSIAFSQSSSTRITASTAASEVAAARQVDLSIYSLWLQMKAANDESAASYVEKRFTDRFRIAFDAWVAQGGATNSQTAPLSPFALPSYVPPGTREQVELNAQAEAKTQEALRNNQRGDNYTILGVLFAVVLFFAAMATRFVNRRLQSGMLLFASVAFVGGVGFLLTFPKLI